MRFKLIIGLFFCISILMGCMGQEDVVMTADTESLITEEVQETVSSKEQTAQSEEIYVYVCGYVKQPGVYCLTEESRICDALLLAGGVLEDGNAEALNQAEHVTDGQTLYVPGIGENIRAESASEEDGLLNINTAVKEDFMALPGIGESKAVAIIQYRQEHGSFESIEELMEIPGIKEGVFNKIKDKIKI
ncbi:MAG: ComEA family DNA-binding protein [Lachnospiraceae bacterium]|nr:ComEA family DNA-binding protein [Lachnospiraceae bacterium]